MQINNGGLKMSDEQTAAATSPIIAALKVIDVEDRIVGTRMEGEVETAISELWVTYKTTSVSGGNTITDRYIDLIDIGDFDDPDDIRGQILRARAMAIEAGVKQLQRGGNRVMPDGHMGLREWGALAPAHVAAFEHAGILSIQQLRDAPHGILANMRLGSDPISFQERARAFLIQRQDSSVGGRIEEMRAGYDEKMKAMEANNARLTALLEQALDKLTSDDSPKSRNKDRELVKAA
jgi:hypothetical protein